MSVTKRVIINPLNAGVSSPISRYESHIHLFFPTERLFYHWPPPIPFSLSYTAPEAANIFLS